MSDTGGRGVGALTAGPAAGDRAVPGALALPPPRDAALLAIALSGVASSGPLIAATAAPALAIAFWRNALGAAVTGTLAATRNRVGTDRRGLLLAGAAGVFLALHFGTWIPSLTMTTVATSTALVATQPVWAAFIVRARGGGLPARAWLGIGVAVAAIVIITGVDVGSSARAVGGDLLALAGGAAAAVYMSFGAAARVRMPTSLYTTVCYSTCAVVLAVAAVVAGQPLLGFGGNAWFKIIVLTVVAQLLGHTLFNLVLRSTSPTVLSLALLLEVPGAALIAWAALGQRPGATLWLGVAVLVVGLVLVVSARPAAQPVEAVE